MPLREIGEYHAWIERERPSGAARSVARTFIAEIGDAPWRAPSAPIAALSIQPEYELRVAAVDVPDEDAVWVWYLHVYATGDFDIVAVTNR